MRFLKHVRDTIIAVIRMHVMHAPYPLKDPARAIMRLRIHPINSITRSQCYSRMRLPPWTLLATSVATTCAKEVEILVESSVSACVSLVANGSWQFGESEYYGSVCGYEPAVGSWILCIEDFLHDQGPTSVSGMREMSVINMNHRCRSLDSFKTPFTEKRYMDSLHNASLFIEDGSTVNMSGSAPVRFDAEYRRSLGQAWMVNLHNLNTSNAASMYLYGFLALLSLLAAVTHFFSGFFFRQKVVNQVRGFLTLPTLSQKHAQPVSRTPGGLFPTRLELGIIIGFLVAHAVALCYRYEFDNGEAMEGIYMQTLKYVGYRTGLLAFAQCPLIIFFSGRNSMFELMTGLHYTTSIVLHKWISRLMTFDAFVHGVIFVLRAYEGGYLGHAKESRFWVCGALTLYVSLTLCILAFGILRHRWYEFFLVTHIFLAIAFFYYAWQHVKALGWCGWVYASIGLWIIEKVLRAIRIMAFGGVVCARAELYEPDIIRVTIPKPRKGWRTHPGEYVFLYFLFPKTWWQSHPFTFVDREDSIVVVIKAKKGVTSNLFTRVKESGGSAYVSVCVEGPYGESAAVADFDNKLFVCGGSGIPGPLSYVLNTPKPQMLLVIVVRDLDMIRAFRTEILALPETSVQIYITKPGTVHNSINDPEWDGRKSVVRGRRPDISALVHESLEASGSLAVTCCGPPALVDMTRDITAKALRSSPTKCVAYFEEYQTW